MDGPHCPPISVRAASGASCAAGGSLCHQMAAVLSSPGMTSRAAAALTQISAYITYIDLAVRKIMEVMRTTYAKSGIQSQHVSNYT